MRRLSRTMIASSVAFALSFAAGPMLLGQEGDDDGGEGSCARCGPNSGCVTGFSSGIDPHYCKIEPGETCPTEPGCGIT